MKLRGGTLDVRGGNRDAGVSRDASVGLDVSVVQ